MSLIQKLKKEHKLITSVLENVNNLGIGTKECRAALLNAKQLLISHLQKEDEDLYPKLEIASKNSEHIRRTLKTFAADMDKISEMALAFFNKYADGGNGVEFSRDYGRLYSMLSLRIRKEESVLYELYDSLA